MKRDEFYKRLRDEMSGMPSHTIDNTISYYEEIISDAVEDGRLEEDVIASFGSVESIVNNLLKDVSIAKLKIDSFTGDIIFTDGFDIEAVEIETDTGDISFVDFSSENVKASTSTGDIELKNGVAENIDIDSSTGRITLEDINGTSLEGDTSTGNINLKNVICTGEMDLSSQTGDIKFDHSDANNIDVTTSTGDIFGTILTPKVFICSSSTGNVNVPSTNSGGRFEANTSTGNIEITIAP